MSELNAAAAAAVMPIRLPNGDLQALPQLESSTSHIQLYVNKISKFPT